MTFEGFNEAGLSLFHVASTGVAPQLRAAVTEGSLPCLVIDAGHWLGLRLGLWLEYLHLAFPRVCLASSHYKVWVPKVREDRKPGERYIFFFWSRLQVIQGHFYLVLFT